MDYYAFLDRVIDDGIAAARESYKDKPNKLRGSVNGFKACRGKTPPELLELLANAETAMVRAMDDMSEAGLELYWERVCYREEIDWVCNTVSAAMVNQGDTPIVNPTARGMMNAARILGVAP